VSNVGLLVMVMAPVDRSPTNAGALGLLLLNPTRRELLVTVSSPSTLTSPNSDSIASACEYPIKNEVLSSGPGSASEPWVSTAEGHETLAVIEAAAAAEEESGRPTAQALWVICPCQTAPAALTPPR